MWSTLGSDDTEGLDELSELPEGHLGERFGNWAAEIQESTPQLEVAIQVD